MIQKIDKEFKSLSVEFRNGKKIDMKNCRLDYSPTGDLFLVNDDSISVTEDSFRKENYQRNMQAYDQPVEQPTASPIQETQSEDSGSNLE